MYFVLKKEATNSVLGHVRFINEKCTTCERLCIRFFLYFGLSAGCDDPIQYTGDSGIIRSPGRPGIYGEGMYCEYQVTLSGPG